MPTTASHDVEKLSQRELTAMKQNAQMQIVKLQQALESIKQSLINNSLHAENCAASPFPKPSGEKMEEVTKYVSAISVLLNDFAAQRDSATNEIERRALEKRRHVETVQSHQSSNLDTAVAKSMKKHLEIAEAARYDKLADITAENRRHEAKVTQIRKQIEEQRLRALEELHQKEKLESNREEALATKQQELQAERRRRMIEKEERLSEKLRHFDEMRMKALQTGPRVEGSMMKDLTEAREARPNNSHPKPTSIGAQTAQRPLDNMTSVVTERLTKPPPRGIGLQKELDTVLENHVLQAQRTKNYIAAECRERRERREKQQAKLSSDLYAKKEEQRLQQQKRAEEERNRIASKKIAQLEQLESMTAQREARRREAYERGVARDLPLVDHWASRARMLIASACSAAIDATGSRGSPLPGVLPRGFEEAKS